MARPTLLSERSEPAPDSAAPSVAPYSDVVPRDPARRDLAEWLTRDLRVKGAPSERPSAEPPPTERSSQPQTVVVGETSEPELASWLLQDLKPRSSAPPELLSATLMASRWDSESLAAPVASQPADAPPGDSAAGDAQPGDAQPGDAQPGDALAADSLVPHAVSQAPAPLALRDVALDEEDLAVLPSRRGKKRDWRKLVVLAALLSVGGAVLWVLSAPRVEQEAGAAAAAAPAVLTAPLPPPPPADAELAEPVAEPEPAAPAAAAGQGTGAGAEAEEAPLDPGTPGPRGRRAGDAVARFADLPSPTLSRLAREEQERARKAAATARQGEAKPEL